MAPLLGSARTPCDPASPRGLALRHWGILLVAIAVIALMVSPVPSPLLGQSSAAATPAPPSLGGWVDISNVYYPSGLQLGAPLAPGANVAGSLTFSESNPSGASNVATAVNTPSSPYYQHYLQGDQFDATFGPSAALQSELSNYLASQGIVVSVVSVFLWNVRGTASGMDAAFGTSFVSARGPAGQTGYAPATPMRLPSDLSSGVQATGAFQNAVPAEHPENLVGKMMRERSDAVSHPAPRTAVVPHATLTLNVTNPFIVYPTANNFENESYDYAPTGMNESYTLTITGGTAPYDITWWWGDGTLQYVVANSGTLVLSHNFPFPGQTDYCDADFAWTCLNMTVTATDGSGDSGIFQLGIVPITSPRTDELFYNAMPLYQLGDTGQGTKIGLVEMCDTGYPTADYMTDLNYFSAAFGLPLVTTTTLQLIGSGDTDHKCTVNGGGSTGWAGETLLDMEWSHSMAPNATLVVDLAASLPQEGDAAFDNLANGVYVDSNSWGCSYNSTAQGGCGAYFADWNQAAAQGQSFLVASGDCGAVMFGYNPPADSPSAVGVGGTDIYPFASGIFRTEFAWNGSVYDPTGCENDEGSTGGYASNYAQFNTSGIAAPWYQLMTSGFGANVWRGVPDVAAIGGTWVEQYQAIYGGWFPDAGTSLASPTTAGMLDLIYDYNGTGTKANGLADNDLYEIANGPNYDLAMHQITVGNNIVWSTPLDYSTLNFGPCATCYNNTPGWNPVDGLGSADVGNLAELMAEQNGNPHWLSALTPYLATNVTYGPLGLDVNFGADVVGGPASLTGYSYLWQFGDGSTATTSQPWTSYAYTTCGGNLLASVVVSAPGVAPVTSNIVPIHVSGGSACPFTASISANQTSGSVGLPVSFLGSAAGGSTPYTWSWEFGDGSAPSALQDPSHTFSKVGTFQVNLTVTDSLGHTAMATTVITTTALVPLAASASATPTSGATPLDVVFTGGATGGTSPYTWSWNFGDSSALSTVQDPSHTYSTVGTYVAVLTATDARGSTNSSRVVIVVSAAVQPLSVSLGAPTTATVGIPASFSAVVSGGTSPYTFAWSFGDGGTSALQDPMYTYAAAGTMPIELTVKDSSTPAIVSHTFTNVSVVAGAATLSVSIAASASSGSAPFAMTFTSTVTGGTPGYTYAWTFGNGGTSAVADPTYTYSAAGTFTVSLVVTDSAGHTATSNSLTVTVSSTSQKSNSTSSPLSGSLLYVLLAAVILAAVVIAALVLRRKKKGGSSTMEGSAPPPPTAWTAPAPGTEASSEVTSDGHAPETPASEPPAT